MNSMTAVESYPSPGKAHGLPVRHYDVVIVGGGIVGLTLAHALGQSGLNLAIVEAQTPAQAASRQRAYAFSPTSADIFRQLGLWEQVSPHLTHFQQVQLSDGDHPIVVRFSPADLAADDSENSGQRAVYYAAAHGVLMAALQGNLQQGTAVDGVDYLAPAQLQQVVYESERVRCTLAQAGTIWDCTTDLIVAADGARSHLREQAGIDTFGWPYWQSCITTVLMPERPHNNIAYERFWPSGPFAILPLVDGRCQIVWTAPHGEAAALLQLPRDRFLAELQRRYGDQMGSLAMVQEPLIFPVRLMQSRRYVQPRLALVGDAAHGCHPVGGQGLNLGIRDAAALAQVLIAARDRDRNADLGSLRVLRRYERWRRWENGLVLALTDLLNRSFSNHYWPLVPLRRLGLWAMHRIPPLRALALRLMTGHFGRRPRLPNPQK
ncbi:FAD-dependent hydroxylase [Leptolyngbya sp. PCC 6406]|uniref:FAD-dependent hydroxylase n=1 Tax=Leptolyngbya sp. PCC 6406 TaxID=1173264 RepID=UPI0002ABFC34|nr:FAD-dependent hydroxylase [Leptolyngbya sp. PCC 6406]